MEMATRVGDDESGSKARVISSMQRDCGRCHGLCIFSTLL